MSKGYMMCILPWWYSSVDWWYIAVYGTYWWRILKGWSDRAYLEHDEPLLRSPTSSG